MVTGDRALALLGGIEAGGTKFVCALGRGETLLAQVRIPTTSPGETLRRVVDWFRERAGLDGTPEAFGVASFGPVDLDPASPTRGTITRTPKPGWSGADLVGPLQAAFGRPVGFATDVEGAGLAEASRGAGRDVRSLVYLTIGTGIGGGYVRDGRAVHGAFHAEMGHLRVPRHPDDAVFAGSCPFHGDCLEGLASGTAARARWGRPLEELGDDHPGWGLLGHYAAQLCCAVALLVAPHRIVLGGGVARGPRLLPAVRDELPRLLAGYPPGPWIEAHADRFVVAPGLGERAGVLGALLLAEQALEGRSGPREPAADP